MKTLPSRLYPNCSFSAEKAAGFYDIVPDGFEDIVSICLGAETVQTELTNGKINAGMPLSTPNQIVRILT